MFNKKNHSGFTLVEILIVTSIILILASMSVGPIIRAMFKGDEAYMRKYLKTLADGCETYQANTGKFPTDITSLTSPVPPYVPRPIYETGVTFGAVAGGQEGIIPSMRGFFVRWNMTGSGYTIRMDATGKYASIASGYYFYYFTGGGSIGTNGSFTP